MDRKMKRKQKKTLSPGIVVWNIAKFIMYVSMIFFGLTFILSLVWILVNSFKTAPDYMQDAFKLPQTFDWKNYKQVFENLEYKGYGLLGMIGNSMILVLWGWLVALTLPHMAGYVMARFNFKGRKLIEKAVWVSMIIPVIGTGSSALWFVSRIGLYDNFLGVFLMNAGSLGFSSIIYTSMYKGMSKSYAEAAYMDGASEWMVFTRIYYPQALPVTFIFLVQSFIATWGDYMTPYLYLPNHPTFALGLQQMQAQFVDFGNDYPVLFAAIVISLIPVLTLYLLFHKKITGNVALGAMK